MGLEAVNYIADLNASNPADTDLETQGAAHLRNIKKALLNTFPGASRTVGVQRISVKTSNYSVSPADSLTTFLVDTSAGIVNITLPTLGATDTGWEIQVIKTSLGTSPILIAPTSGTLASGGLGGLSSTRRCVPGTPTRIIWTGSGFFCTRAGAAPVGAVLEFDGPTLPIGYEWPNGQVLASATNYPDYFAALGTLNTIDRREYVAIASDMGTSSPGRIVSGVVGIDPTTIGSAGGIQANSIMISNLPPHHHPAYMRDPTHFHSVNGLANPGGFSVAPGGVGAPSPGPVSVNTAPASTGIHVNNGVGGSGTDDITGDVGGGVPTNNCQPSIIKNFILVVE